MNGILRLFVWGISLLISSASYAAYEDLVFTCKVEQFSNVSIHVIDGETYIGGETGPSELIWVIGAGRVHMEDISNYLPCRFSESLIECADPATPNLKFTYYRRPNAFVVQGFYAGSPDGKEQFFVFAGKCEQLQ